jgi:hypothetical protein
VPTQRVTSVCFSEYHLFEIILSAVMLHELGPELTLSLFATTPLIFLSLLVSLT